MNLRRHLLPSLVLLLAAPMACDDPFAPIELSVGVDSVVVVAGDSAWVGPVRSRYSTIHWNLVDWHGRDPRPEVRAREGWVLGYGSGEGGVQVTDGEELDTVPLRVLPGPAVGAGLNGGIRDRLEAGQSWSATAAALDKYGNPTEGQVSWVSRDTEVLLVDRGTLLAVGPGRTIVAVGLEGGVATDSMELTVLPAPARWRELLLTSEWSWPPPHTCFLSDAGYASCLGDNQYGQVGYVTPFRYEGVAGQYAVRDASRERRPVDTDLTFRTLASAPGHTCGLSADGIAYCWGSAYAIGNDYGVLTCSWAPITRCRFYPWPVTTDVTFGDISASCGVTAGGDVWCWAEDVTQVFSGTELRTIEGDSGVGCGLSTEGRAYCWGPNDSGQLGIGTADTLPHTEPVPVATDLRFTDLSIGTDHRCAIATDGSVHCWGSGHRGQLGTTAPLDACIRDEEEGPIDCGTTPVRVDSALTFAEVAAARAFTCALAADGTVHCWGVNSSGELGTGSDTGPESCDGVACSRTPIQVGIGQELVTLATGVRRVCAAAANLGIHCWGANDLDP